MINDPAVERKLIGCFPFLASNNCDLNTQLLQTASLARLEAGQFVCHEGHTCPQLALILEGSARVYKLGESGREITLYRVEPGQSCILTASCIISRKPFPATAVCEQPLLAVLIPNRDVKRWMSDYEVWHDYIFGLVADRLSDIISVVEEVVFRRMDHRISEYLSKRAMSSRNSTLKLTHQQIASDLGTSREVVSRILKDFESKGWLQVGRGSIHLLDPDSLRSGV